MFADPGQDATFKDSKVAYSLYWYEKGKFFNGFKRNVAQSDLAAVREDYAKHADGGLAERLTFPIPPVPASPWVSSLFSGLPFHRTAYYNTNGGVAWDHLFFEDIPGTDPEFPFPETLSSQENPKVKYQAGKTYAEQWNRGVFGPAFPAPVYPTDWVSRVGDEIFVALPLYSDRAGHLGFSGVDMAKLTLFRNGKKVGEIDDYFAAFPVPAGKANYRLQVRATRGGPFSLSTRINTAWTFKSGHVYGEAPAPLALSTVRFTPELNPENAAPTGTKFTLPIAVQRQPDAPAAKTKSLTVEVSYDDGAHWKTVKLSGYGEKWTAELTHPNKPGFVSLRAKATDTSGNTVEQTIIRAYRITAHSND